MSIKTTEIELVKPEDVGLSSLRLDRIRAHLQSYIDAGKLAGTLTLVARRGRIAYFEPQGHLELEGLRPMQRDTIFRIYSMTKPITNVAFMMLYERGLFHLDDPVRKFIPSWRDLRVYVSGAHPNFVTKPAERPMTIRDLLTHTSGLMYGSTARSQVDAAYRQLGVAEMGTADYTLQDMVDQLAQLPLEFSPGTRWQYSVATDVVGYLVEVLSGQSFDAFLRDHIFAPLGMRDTSFLIPRDRLQRFAHCYIRQADGGLALFDAPQTSEYRQGQFWSGGSGLLSTAADYYRFASMLLHRGEWRGVRLLGRKTLDFMTQNHLPGGQDLSKLVRLGAFSESAFHGVGFGLGFSVLQDATRVAGSSGEYAWGGFASTAFWIDPVEELIVIFMTQLVPSSAYPLRRELRGLAYGALLD